MLGVPVDCCIADLPMFSIPVLVLSGKEKDLNEDNIFACIWLSYHKLIGFLFLLERCVKLELRCAVWSYFIIILFICAAAFKATIRDNKINQKKISLILSVTQDVAGLHVFSWEVDKCFKRL